MYVVGCILRVYMVGCFLQVLDAALRELPFEVDANPGTDFGNVVVLDKNVNAGNKLTAQASKQGENFVASPKPASTQGFSFDAEPVTNANAPSTKPTTTPVSNIAHSDAVAAVTGGKHKHTAGHSFWPHFLFGNSIPAFGHDSFFSKLNPFTPSREADPFDSYFSFGTSNFFEPDFPVDPVHFSSPYDTGFPFRKPTKLTWPPMYSLDNMKLVEDRTLDDKYGRGSFRTYKSEDGNSIVQIMEQRRGGRLGAPGRIQESLSRGRARLPPHPRFRRRAH